MVLPEDYIAQKFHQLAGYVKFKRSTNVYEGGCPMCKEGKSWGRKRRLYYIVKSGTIYCHNCGWSGNAIKFIKEVGHLTYEEIMNEAKDYDLIPEDVSEDKYTRTNYSTEILPHDSINLFDEHQVEYHKDNEPVKMCLELIHSRRLHSAVNRPKSLYVSLTDFTHKNRLVIPFYDQSGDIAFYQSRTVVPNSSLPKYLSKSNSEKTLFNLNNINSDIDHLFIFEGPIDACFVRNGTAVAGIQENSDRSLSAKQRDQLTHYNFFDQIWVLDSQWQDSASKSKTLKLAEQGHRVFVWPEKYGKRFKDFNDMAVALNISEIPYKFILDNTHTGLKVRVLLNVT
tara:strand:+ start:13634 stop:14653 length:1020 start_codon:yes stop_codon:yes gene_type:complete